MIWTQFLLRIIKSKSETCLALNKIVEQTSLKVIFVLGFCSSLLSVAVINTMVKATWGERGLFGSQVMLHHWRKSGQEFKAGACRPELKQRPWGSTAYWLVLSGLLSLLVYVPQDHLPGSAPHQSSIKKIAADMHKANLMEANFQLRSLVAVLWTEIVFFPSQSPRPE